MAMRVLGIASRAVVVRCSQFLNHARSLSRAGVNQSFLGNGRLRRGRLTLMDEWRFGHLHQRPIGGWRQLYVPRCVSVSARAPT